MARGAHRVPPNVVFDVGNVLLAWDPRELVRQHVADAELRDKVLGDVFGHADWVDLDRGTLAEPEALRRFQERTGLPAAVVADLVHASKETLTPMPAGYALLDELEATDGVRVFCLTNMSHETFAYLCEKFDLFPRFEDVLVSAQEGLVKPDPEIFRLLCRRNGLDPDRTAFLDDNPANVAGARAAGLRAQVFGAGSRDWLFAGAPREA